MRPRCLLAAVDRLPTISEQQESEDEDEDEDEDGEPGGPAPTLDQYLDSIRELSRPAPYPLHGPLRGHRRWTACSRVKPAALTLFLSPAPWTPVDPSEVSLIFAERSDCGGAARSGQNLLDLLVGHSLFAGLV